MDGQRARQVCRIYDQIKGYDAEIVQDLMNTMKEAPEFIVQLLSLHSATQHLSQIADHARNIAEDVIYIADGEIVRHHHDFLENPRHS
jgi:phosphate transport system protein